jgi:PAS domain S-box-containing protein
MKTDQGGSQRPEPNRTSTFTPASAHASGPLRGLALPAGYRVSHLLLQSAAHSVYRAQRLEDGRPVLLRVLLRDVATDADIAACKRECELSATVAAACKLAPWTLERSPGGLVLVMEDRGGEPLTKWLGTLSDDPDTCLQIAIGLADTLDVLHRCGLVHRNVNPDSFLVDPATLEIQPIDLSLAELQRDVQDAAAHSIPAQSNLVYISPEQTRRMNRSVDRRSDLYSLGVLLYQMLTGKTPFVSSDPLELVHAHIARAFPLPQEVNSRVPAPLSDLVVKLLAKEPEARYQSAVGLKADLETCSSQLRSTGQIESFALGVYDFADGVRTTAKLYGRERELDLLTDAFERVRRSSSELVLVRCFSGIGKSALVHQLQGPVHAAGGFFIAGKFDQLQHNIPYSSIADALTQLIGQLLSESEDSIARWRTLLTDALGASAQLIVDLIPELELIVGPQPALVRLTGAEAQNRFNRVFQRLLQTFALERSLLVLFLDDLQWADSASLNLLEVLFSAPDMQRVLVIGAFRDNEVDADHVLPRVIEEIERAGKTRLTHIDLKPLELIDLTHLTAEALRCEPEHIAELVQLVLFKTGGNPFFVTQFLKSLHADGLLRFEHAIGHWQFDLERIRGTGMTDNVVTLMADRLQKLPLGVRESLMFGACLGNRFELSTLAVVSETPMSAADSRLREAVRAGLLLQAGDDEHSSEYRFLHDRVQQAAYALIPGARKQELHLKVGRLMLQGLESAAREEKLFDIVNHLSLGSASITAPAERLTVAQLACSAGKRAKAAAAFPAALEYFSFGVGMLASDAWSAHYPLAFDLHLETAECLYLCGQFGAAEQTSDLLLERAGSDLDRARVYDLLVLQYESLSRYADAIRVGHEGLALFGVTFPNTPEQRMQALEREMAAIDALVGHREIETLTELPPMHDAEHRAVLKLLANLHTPCYLSGDKPLTLLNTAAMVRLSLEHGNMEDSAYAYVLYAAMLLGPVREDHEAAYAFGMLAIRVNAQFENRALRARVLMMFAWAVSPWRRPLQESLPITREAFTLANETGLFVDAAYALFNESWFALLSKASLEEFCATYPASVEYVNRVKMHRFADAQHVILQWGRALRGLTVAPTDLTDLAFDDADYCERHRGEPLFEMLYRVAKLSLLYTFGQYQEARAIALEAERVIADFPGTIWDELTTFYHALALAAVYDELEGDERVAVRARLGACMARLEKWAQSSPHLFRAQHAIVSAEIARLDGGLGAAITLYEHALHVSAELGCAREAGLANELCARFWQGRKQDRIAAVFIAQARQCYRDWGATAKVQQLEAAYPQWLEPESGASRAADRRPTTLNDDDVLDLSAVLKAAQTISREIVLERLLQSLMNTVLETAGASRGILILDERGRWLVEAEGWAGEAGGSVLRSIPIEAYAQVSHAIINYVRRTVQSLVIDNAQHDPRFAHDVYIAAAHPPSILCVPILNVGKLTGILYLENELTGGAFTPARLEVMQILSSTIAISIENARLYVEMEQEVNERKRAEQQIRSQAMLLDKASDAIFVCDLEDRITYWNQGAERLYGWPSAEALGRDFAQTVVCTGDPSTSDQAARSVMERGEWTGELHQRSRGGVDLIVQSRWTLLRGGQNRPESVLMINTDVTEKKRMEEHFLRAQRMESIGTLAGGIAHDLNNVLTPITLAAETLQANRHAELNQQLLDMIQINAKRGAEIASQVLAFARGVEGKRLTLNPIHVLEEIAQIARQTFPRSIDIQVHQSAALWSVSGDPTQLHQVLLNLSLNARDAMPHGGMLRFGASNVTVDDQYARLYPDAVPGRYVLLSVSDTGVGIAPQLIGRVFEPFFTTKEIGKGTGLGLSIVAGIVRSHGGFANVFSEPGKGARFEIHLPALCAEPRLDSEARRALPMGAGQHVLLVDDETSVLEVTRATLEANGYRVTIAHDGPEALATYARVGADLQLVLMDWMMPYMEGAAIVRALQKLDPKVRVVVSSGVHTGGNPAEVAGLSVSGFLPKPYTAHALLSVVHEAVGALDSKPS